MLGVCGSQPAGAIKPGGVAGHVDGEIWLHSSRMPEDTLLAHLADRFVTQRENLATEALAFQLQNPAVASVFFRHARRFRSSLEEIIRYETQQATGDGNGIPDLVGIGRNGQAVLLVEAKFAAVLTPNQPVGYLRRLAQTDQPGLLLFLVPARRTIPVWAELQQRCSDAGLSLADSDGQQPSRIHGMVTVAVTTWGALLDDLEDGLNPTDHRQELADLAQLRGLCERDDREAFVPLTGQEIGGTIGQRLVDLDSILNEAAAILQAEGIADLRGLKWSAGQGWFGRYLKLGGWECLLHVNFSRWGRQRPTPLWLRVSSSDVEVVDALAPLASEQPSRFLNDDGRNQIPIRLPTDVGRDEVMDEVLQQLREVHRLLPRIPPIGTDVTAPGEM
jgi:hypothetical protein